MMKVEGKFGEWTLFDGTNPPAIPGSYLVACVNSVERGATPLIYMYEWGHGFFDDDTIEEAFYYYDSEWGDVPINPYVVLAWMPLPPLNFDWQTLTDEYWERMKKRYGR